MEPALVGSAGRSIERGGGRPQRGVAHRGVGRTERIVRARRGDPACRLLGAPVAKALLGKAVLPDDSPFTTGGIGDLGTAPSSWAMQNCDTVLILGSPNYDFGNPDPGKNTDCQSTERLMGFAP
jgi:hypothetical protein